MRTLTLVLDSKTRKSVDHMISRTADHLETSKLRSIITGHVNVVGDASHSIVTTVCLQQPQPDDPEYYASDTPKETLVSPIVMRALLCAHGIAAYEHLIHFLDTFSKIPQARASTGWVWEHWANAQICKGGTFRLEPITFKQPARSTNREKISTPISDTTQPIFISISPRTIHCFDDKESPSTTVGNDYFIPARQNNAIFDAFFHSEDYGIGLQMTLSDTHSLKAGGLKKLHDRLQARKITQHMYVVVIRRGHKFKNFKPNPTPKQRDQFQFFTMELEVPVGMCLFLPSTCATADIDNS